MKEKEENDRVNGWMDGKKERESEREMHKRVCG
jgi:hypothetical protein